MRVVRVAAAAIAVAMMSVVPVTSVVAVADPVLETTDPFPMVGFRDMVVDSVQGHVFLSGGDVAAASGNPADLASPSDVVVVRGLDGQPQAVLDRLPGATGLALDTAHSLLYVALSRADAVVAFSTRTLTEIARYPTGEASAPVWLAMDGSIDWFSGSSGMGAIDPSATVAAPVVVSSRCSRARLRSTPGAPGVIVSMVNYQLCVFRVRGTEITGGVGAAYDGYAQPFVLTPDGTEMIVGTAVYRTSDLVRVGVFGGPPDPSDPGFPTWLAFDAQGHLAIGRQSFNGSSDLLIVDRTSVLTRLKLGTTPFAVAFTADSSALYYPFPGYGPGYSNRLGIVRNPLWPGSDVTLSGPGTVDPGDPVTLTGSVTVERAPRPDATLRVTREDGQGATTLDAVRTDARGAFAVSDVPRASGLVTYRVRYDGAGTYRPSYATTSVRVRAATSLTALTPPRDDTPRDLSVSGRLTSEGQPLADAVVSYGFATAGARTYFAGTRTASDGTYTITVKPVTQSDPYSGSFTVGYGGDGAHQPASVQLDDSARRPAEDTVLTLAPGRTERPSVTGTLRTVAAGGFAGRLTVTRTDAGGEHRLADVEVGADGNVNFQDPTAIGGPNTYTVGYAGEGFHRPARSTVSIALPRTVPTVTVATDRALYPTGAAATVTAHLGATAASRTLAVYATPYGGAARLVGSGPVDAAGTLRLRATVTANTTFSAVFAGDAATAPRTGTTSVQSTAAVASSVAGYYTRAGGYVVFHRVSRPTATVSVTPAKPNTCVRVNTQRVLSGQWRTVAVSGCATLDRSSRRVLSLNSRAYLPGVHYRLRFEWAGDRSNVAGVGAWQFLQFR